MIIFAFLAFLSAIPLGEQIEKSLVAYHDFPQKGIVFRDISPLLENPLIFSEIIDHFYDRYKHAQIDAVVALDARGFLFGSPLAYKLKVPLVMVRKDGKLPGSVYKASYQKIYGQDTSVIRADALKPGQKVVVIDDFYSTGGTVKAASELIRQSGASVFEAAFVINNHDVKEKQSLDFPVYSLFELRKKS